MSIIKYTGTYGSSDGHTWRAEIEQTVSDGSSAITTGAALEFAPSAAEIEWPGADRYEALEGSACTLTVISPDDRTFAGLYTESVGNVTLHLYRDGVLWWAGIFDPEQYEEPYQDNDHYEVVLTFSDLGQLERMPYSGNPSGNCSLATLIHRALTAVSQPSTGVTNMFDLRKPDTTVKLTADTIAVNQANYFDEDGEPLKWSDVLAGALGPLGLRLVQRCGRWYLYDLPTLYASASAAIRWASDSQTLGVDKVYNNFELTYSPYGDEHVMSGEVDSDLQLSAMSGSATYYNANPDDSERYEGFTVEWGSASVPGISWLNGAYYYRMHSVYSGTDGTGIVACLRSTSGSDTAICGNVYNAGRSPDNPSEPWGVADPVPMYYSYDNMSTMISMTPCRIEGSDAGYQLKITLDMLLDCRYNPFESASEHNEEGDYQRQSERWTRVYVPVRIWIECDNGRTYHVANDYLRRSAAYDRGPVWGGDMPVSLHATHWESGAGVMGDCWLSYYDWTDPTNKSACAGWATNRQTIGQRHGNTIPPWWQKRGDGLFVTAPIYSGTLHFEVGRGVAISDTRGRVYDTHDYTMNPTYINQARWLLYRNPAIELVDANGLAIDVEDIVYRAHLNDNAREQLQVDTITGSTDNTLPTARGLYYVDGVAVSKLTRGTITDTIERLMIAAIASQYDCRHTKLSGDATIDTGLQCYTEASQPSDRRFIRVSSVQRTAEGVAEDTYIELSDQKYYTTV